MDEENIRKYLALAKEAGDRAYAPYSGFRVGAALLAEDGRVFLGCNVENVSYGATICAERVALAKGISEGARRFSAIFIISGGKEFCAPCGICRQCLMEFSLDMQVFIANGDEEYQAYGLQQLLPSAFNADSME